MAPPVHGVPVQDVVLRSVHFDGWHRHHHRGGPAVSRHVSNLPFGSALPAIRLHRLTCPCQHAFAPGHQGPVSGQLCETASGGAGPLVRFPVAFRPPAFASWASCPAEDFGLLTIGLPPTPEARRTPTGFPRSARVRHGWGGCPLYPEAAVFTRPRSILDRRLPPSIGRSLPPGAAIRPEDVQLTRHQQGFTGIHPPSLPLACAPPDGPRPLGFPVSFAPDRPGGTRPARHGGDRSRTLTGVTSSTSVDPPST